MNRFLWVITFVGLGLVLIAFGLTTPAHLRALDARVVLREQPGNPSVVSEALSVLSRGKIGPATLLYDAARNENISGADQLSDEIKRFSRSHPNDLLLGGADPVLGSILQARSGKTGRQPIVDLLISRESREAVLRLLSNSQNPTMAKLLAIRNMTNTTHFPPVNSAAGQPLEAAILLTGLLMQENQLSTPLRDRIEYLAVRSRWDNNLELMELIFLDMISVGRHLSWTEMADFLSKIQDPLTFQRLASRVALGTDKDVTALFAVVHMAPVEAPVATYLNLHEQTGLTDLSYSLRAGRGGLRLVLDRQQRLYRPSPSVTMFGSLNPLSNNLAEMVAQSEITGIAIKLGSVAVGAFLIALAMARSIPGSSGQLFFVPEIFFSLVFLATTVFLTEPYLTHQSQAGAFPLQWRFPMASGAVRAAIEKKVNPMVDTLSIISLLVFMIIQITIYIFCRRKLGEIRRQALPSRLKLRLLENEEHLFDAGLYVGFVGTVLSLVCVSIGIIKPSLMAAYSSTSFGIIFVTVLKIFHLRPYRKQLIMDTEATAQ